MGAEGVGPVEEGAVPFAEVSDALIGGGVILAEMGRLRVREETREAFHAQLRLEERGDVGSQLQAFVEGIGGGTELRQQGLQVLVAKEEDLIKPAGDFVAEADLALEGRTRGPAEHGVRPRPERERS